MDYLLKNIVKGTVKGPHGRGRPRRVWTNDLEERLLGKSFVKVQKLVDRSVYQARIFHSISNQQLAESTFE